MPTTRLGWEKDPGLEQNQDRLFFFLSFFLLLAFGTCLSEMQSWKGKKNEKRLQPWLSSAGDLSTLTFKVECDGGRGFTKVVLGISLVLPCVAHGDLSNLQSEGVGGPLGPQFGGEATARPKRNGLVVQDPANHRLRVCRQLALQHNLVAHLANGWLLQKHRPGSLDLTGFGRWVGSGVNKPEGGGEEGETRERR